MLDTCKEVLGLHVACVVLNKFALRQALAQRPPSILAFPDAMCSKSSACMLDSLASLALVSPWVTTLKRLNQR